MSLLRVFLGRGSVTVVLLLMQCLGALEIRIDQRVGESWRGRVGGLPTLVLRGDMEGRAQAHGQLTAAEILAVINDYVIPAAGGPQPYESLLAPLVASMHWSQRSRRELSALHQGMLAALGEQGLHLAALGRVLQVEDLLIANALPDWAGFACSSLSVWGDSSSDGRTRHARNLDYPHNPSLLAAQFLILQMPTEETELATLGLSFAGSIGVYTAISAQGIFVAIHDVPVSERPQPRGAHPRSVTLARSIQGASDIPALIRGLDDRQVVMGNNILIGDADRAVVAEWSPATTGRALAWNPDPGQTFLACTNHHQGQPGPHIPDSHRRINSLHKAASTALDSTGLQRALHSVSNHNTIHSVIVDPAARELTVALMTRPGRSATRGPWVTISWDTLITAQ